MSKAKKRKKKDKNKFIQAAGGLVWDEANGGRQIALVHRPRYDDWTFPKGKLDKGESWRKAARREVQEETGCKARLGKFAGCSCYHFEGQPKVVLYWHMTLLEDRGFSANEEVDELRWLSPEQALEKLSYDGERAILMKWLRRTISLVSNTCVRSVSREQK